MQDSSQFTPMMDVSKFDLLTTKDLVMPEQDIITKCFPGEPIAPLVEEPQQTFKMTSEIEERIRRVLAPKPAPRVRKTDIGRNDACHCNSGKKYKKCHMDSDTKYETKNVKKKVTQDEWNYIMGELGRNYPQETPVRTPFNAPISGSAVDVSEIIDVVPETV